MLDKLGPLPGLSSVQQRCQIAEKVVDSLGPEVAVDQVEHSYCDYLDLLISSDPDCDRPWF